MLIPHPETNLQENTLVLGARVIELLKKSKGKQVVEKLLQTFLSEDSGRTAEMFFESVLFLYIFGIIKQDGFKIILAEN